MLIHFLLTFTLAFTAGGVQQTSKGGTNPDFTGTWNARILADPKAPIELLKIAYNEPKLEISSVRIDYSPTIVMGHKFNTPRRDFVYYTDGRGETQKSPVPGLSRDINPSKTELAGSKFVTTYSSTSGKKVITDSTVAWEVSSDGKTLTKTIRLSSEGNTSRIVYLYDRVSGTNTTDINGEWKQRNSNRLVSLTIEHHDPVIKVTRRVVTDAQDDTETSVYYTDGRGEINVKDGRTLKSVTTWKDQILSFSLSRISTGNSPTFHTYRKIKWEISNGGQSLSEITETKMSMDNGLLSQPLAEKLIYARSSKRLPE